ncbi:SIMPL domain-containing protein [Dongshaea marina]|uniref:SIMPL domain-containing protein n=1 Tax=Dongshaea marina TaxID=2047966 RepID=UPI000D3EE1BA|nr:SIMPL domain-containing protein [Dongshaea marina]
MKQVISALLLACGVALAGWFIGHNYLQVNEQKTVAVKGLAERDVKSDLGIATFRYSATADTLPVLYRNLKSSQDAIITFLTKSGFAKKEIQIGLPNVTDNFSNNYGDNRKAKRYKAASQIILMTHDVDLVGKSLQQTDQLVSKGIVLDNVQLTYRYTSLNQIKQQMLTEAVKNAQNAAEVFATNAHAKLGKIKFASQGQFSISDANGSYSNNDVMKKVRVVSSVRYQLH